MSIETNHQITCDTCEDEDRDPHDDDKIDAERYEIDEMLEEIARRIEMGWQIVKPITAL